MTTYGATTTFALPDARFNNYEHVQVNLGSGSVTNSILAPVTGRLVAAFVQSQTTTDGTNKITLAMTNESNSAAEMIPSALYDDDPVITSNTKLQLTLSTTAANLNVTQGDNLELAYTEAGTIAGGAVILYFEVGQ